MQVSASNPHILMLFLLLVTYFLAQSLLAVPGTS